MLPCSGTEKWFQESFPGLTADLRNSFPPRLLHAALGVPIGHRINDLSGAVSTKHKPRFSELPFVVAFSSRTYGLRRKRSGPSEFVPCAICYELGSG